MKKVLVLQYDCTLSAEAQERIKKRFKESYERGVILLDDAVRYEVVEIGETALDEKIDVYCKDSVDSLFAQYRQCVRDEYGEKIDRFLLDKLAVGFKESDCEL